MTHLGRALELYASLGDHMRVAVTLNNMAGADFFNSRWDSAAARFEEAAEAFDKAGDVVNFAFTQLNLGDVWLYQGRWEEALAILTPARRTLEACEYRLMAALATLAVGRAKVLLRDGDAGVALLQSAASSLEETDSPMEQSEAKTRLAEALVFTGRLTEARIALDEARRLAGPSAEGPLSSLLDRIELSLAVASGDLSSALSNLETFLDRARRSGADYEVLMFHALADELGVVGDDSESGELRQRLGIRRLPAVTS
jgi:tetratricopeptide (TPR) repeat protein